MNGSVWEFVSSLDPKFCWLVTMSLLHSLWQGTILAGLAAMVCRQNSRCNVHRKFAVAFGVLLMIASTPVVNFYWMVNSSNSPEAIQHAHQQFTAHGHFLPLFNLNEITVAPKPNDLAILDSPVVHLSPINSTVVASQGPSPELEQARPYGLLVSSTVCVTLAYALGVILMMIRLLMGIRTQWRLSRICERIHFSNAIPASLKIAAEAAAASLEKPLRTTVAVFRGEGVAMVIGCLRPVILINSSIVSGLTPVQLEQIIAHELAHVYRFDPVTQLLQRLIESALFFHPAIWFVSRTVSNLRELCCDEWVAYKHCRVEYAGTLLQCATMNHGNFHNPGSQYSLAAVGSSAGQLTARIESLILDRPQRRTNRKAGRSRSRPLIVIAKVVAVAGCIIGLCLFNANRNGNARLSSLSSQPEIQEQTRAASKPQWKWQTVEANQIKPGAFLFGGKELQLSSSVPSDVRVNAMVVVEHCKFAQWHFGDTSSNRVGVLVELDGDQINRIFLDSNRDRVIEDTEEVSVRINNGKTWLAKLNVEVRENENSIYTERQIGVTPRLKKDSLRITTLGYTEGEIEFDGKKTLVRRIDRDGNGLPNESQDQIWIDLDHDGQFNLINERHALKNHLDIGNQRFAVRSDRLGQSLHLTPIDEQGSIQFVFGLAEKGATLTTFEGSLRDEHGMLIAIRPTTEPVSVPVGRYCVENLVVEARDTEGVNWRMTLLRGLDTGWFEVLADKEHELKLLDSLSVSATPAHRDDGWSEHLTQLAPRISSPGGLVVTNFTNDKKDAAFGPDNSVKVKFKIQGAGIPGNEPSICKSGFF